MEQTQLRAYHGDPAIKANPHTADAIASELLRLGHIRAYPASGNVWSVRRRHLLGCANQRGYLVATLHLRDLRVQAKLHRVVWLAKHSAIPADAVIDHVNGIKGDNRINNLRVVTNAENVRHRRSYRGDGNPASKLTTTQVANIRRLHPRHSYAQIASAFGVSKSLVAQIVRTEVWT